MTRKIFEEELAELKTQLIEMCRLTEQMIADAIRALDTKDRELGKSIHDVDKKVDEYELAIERKCMRLLLTQQPVAKDFREVSTALKMITDIERFGDQASDIGDLVYTMPDQLAIHDLYHIKMMGELAVKMVKDSVNSFVKNDQKLADSVIKQDDQMDEYFAYVQDSLIDLINTDRHCGETALLLMMTAKYLERIGDHAVNVAEWTKYNQTGIHQKF